MLQLNDLYPELLWLIFSVNNIINQIIDSPFYPFASNLYVRNQGRNLSLVSRKFRAVGQALVWHDLELCSYKATDEEEKLEKRIIQTVLSLLRADRSGRLGKYVKILDIAVEEKEGHSVRPGDMIVLANPNRLKPVGYDWVEPIIQQCPTLEQLIIRGTILANPIVILHFLSIIRGQCLQYLKFWIPFDNTDVSFFPIAQRYLTDALLNIPRLKSLEIVCNRTILPLLLLNPEDNRFEINFAQFITAFLSSNGRSLLQHFCLFLPTATFECISDVPFSNLISLELEKGSSSEPSLFCQQATAVLASLQFLQELSVSSNDSNIAETKEVSALLRRLPKTLTYFKTDLFRSTEPAITTFWSTHRCAALTEFILVDLSDNSRINMVPRLQGKL